MPIFSQKPAAAPDVPNGLLKGWLLVAVLTGSAVLSTSAYAQQCAAAAPFVYNNATGIPAAASATTAIEGFNPQDPVEASADNVVAEDDIITLTGNSEISYQDRTLSAENAQYNRSTGEVEVNGEIEYASNGIRLSSQDARINLGETTFSTGQSEYEINAGSDLATGAASNISRTADGRFRLKNATYSTCPPGDNSWFIKADDIVLDTEEGVGTAKDIVLRFKGVPLLAVPWFSFPIGPNRKTGFLAPSIARNESTGLELRIPWYWNIRPNLDATITPRITTRRGVQLQQEWRYLNQQGIWRLDSEFLVDNEEPDGEDLRRFTRIRHRGAFGQRWTTELDASEVSDDEYFQDLGDSLQVASVSHLERRGDLRYSDDTYSFLARVQSFQTIDSTIADDDLPYRKVPQLRFNADWPTYRFGLEADLDAELVYFDRSASVTGTRFDIEPSLSLPIIRTAWYVNPRITSRFTRYDLDNVADGSPSVIERFLPTASVDAGLFFDRPVNRRGKIQTLEPRIFFLRVPFEEQEDIPLFDSLPLDFNFAQLFRENSFSGSDRVTDANQVSLALTTRLIDGQNGREQFLASIGQIFFFDDRRVTVDGEVDTSDVSDFVAEIEADLDNNWTWRSSLQWDPDESRTVRSTTLLSFRPGEDKILNLGHRRVSTGSSAETEQLDISLIWPVFDRWKVAARWNYSLAEDTSIESLVGFEYDDCCWSFRFAARRFISDDGLDHDTNFFLQLVLKGLGPLGENIGALLEASILGYEDNIK